MNNHLPKIYEHIESMRGSIKPTSYDDIRAYLLAHDYPEEQVDHAIKYSSEKELEQLYVIANLGGMQRTIQKVFEGVVLTIVGSFALYISARLIYLFFTAPPLRKVLGMHIYELTIQGHIVATCVFGVLVSLLAVGVNMIKTQLQLRKQYVQKCRQGLL